MKIKIQDQKMKKIMWNMILLKVSIQNNQIKIKMMSLIDNQGR